MKFIINGDELTALCGLPHLQQLVYLRGVRPYMDVKTGIVGIKRRISYQSIIEQLYIESHQGIKSCSFTKTQIRRALSTLERVGLITMQSQDMQLILKCKLATMGYSVQNKVITKPTHQSGIDKNSQPIEIQQNYCDSPQISGIGEKAKADTPLKEENCIYLLSQFEKFWSCYPEKKSRQNAWKVFGELNPDQALTKKIIQAVIAQIKNRDEKQLHGIWVPPWKYPANWLSNQCWNDELTMDKHLENQHATRCKNTKNRSTKDMFWNPKQSEQVDEQTALENTSDIACSAVCFQALI